MLSLLDVILTNAKTNCIRPQNFPTGVSDCHNMIGTLININIPKFEKQKIQYRSFRTLDVHALNNDLQNIDLIYLTMKMTVKILALIIFMRILSPI